MSLKPRNIDFDQTWKGLEQTVHGVVTLGNVGNSVWYNKFTDVYSLCVAHPVPMAEKLYQETKRFLEQHVLTLLKNVSGSPEEEFVDEVFGEGLLKRYYEEWNVYSRGIQYLNCLFLYLNQQHIKKQKVSEVEIIYGSAGVNPEKLEIGELGLLSWERALEDQLRTRITKALLAGVQAARDNQPHQAHILHTVIHSFVEMQAYKKKDQLALYTQMVEDPFLEAAGEHCKRLAADLLQKCDVSSYMKEVLTGMDQELQRGKQFLHPTSISKLKKVYEKNMIEEHLHILHADAQAMVVDEREDDLHNIYKLLRTITDALKPLLKITNEHIKNRGLEAISNLSGDKPFNQFVEKILEIHTKYKNLFAVVFESDKDFLGELDKACTAIINHQEDDQRCKSPKYLAKYCDCLLKKNTRGGLSEVEVEDRLASSIVIFKYINDKDMFQKYYASFMANRFIHQSSCSMDQEETMINRLKQACGYEFTNKLLRMYNDVSISADLNSKFQDYLKKENSTLSISFGIHVLQSGAWPFSGGTGDTELVPTQLERPIQLFETFYRNSFNGRKLTWLHNLCMGELRFCYLHKTYLVTMQTNVMALILEFEKRDALTVEELKKASGLKKHISRYLAPLIDNKILICEGDVEADFSVIKLNMEFSNKRTKIRLTNVSPAAASRDQSENERIVSSVDEDRKMFLQAAIVRIMKARKVLKHTDLLQEVIDQAKNTFTPNVAMIKKCIETLIEKTYIERTLGSNDEYRYLA